uniref:Uncharacterized protein n=1 Tax=Tanacetum cinerariifolium TaxID=118510 RepID=A0A6L2JEX3_TANCI|nr:hypothetical protein [Tanacetum cinerariifolium]
MLPVKDVDKEAEAQDKGIELVTAQEKDAEELPSDTLAETPKVKDNGKGILIEASKPMKKKDQIEMDVEEEMEKEDEEIIKSINETPVQKAAKRRKLGEEAQEANDLRKYPLSKFTLEQLVNVASLQVKEESEMSLELLRFTRQQLQEYQQG